jgi:hypothetical protein
MVFLRFSKYRQLSFSQKIYFILAKFAVIWCLSTQIFKFFNIRFSFKVEKIPLLNGHFYLSAFIITQRIKRVEVERFN